MGQKKTTKKKPAGVSLWFHLPGQAILGLHPKTKTATSLTSIYMAVLGT